MYNSPAVVSRVYKVFIIIITSILTFILLQRSVFATGSIVINEAEFDSIQSGTDSNYEWIELYNFSNSSVTLNGWMIADNTGTTAIPTTDIPPNDYLILVANETAFRENYPKFSGQLVELGKIGNGLSNTGDQLTLIGNSGESDSMSWSNKVSAGGCSLERMPTGTGIFFEQCSPSPGTGTGAPTPIPAPTVTSTPTTSPTSVSVLLSPTPIISQPTTNSGPTSTPRSQTLSANTEKPKNEPEISTEIINMATKSSTPSAVASDSSRPNEPTTLFPKIIIGIGLSLLITGGSFLAIQEHRSKLKPTKSNK